MSGGQQVSVSQGSLTYNLARLPILVEQGFLTPSGENVVVNLSGIDLELELGLVNQVIAGQTITVAAGIIGISREAALTGIQLTASVGFITPNLDADDTFIQSALGTLVYERQATLVGIEIAAGQGTLIASHKQEDLAGSQADFSQGSTVQLIGIPLTGESMTIEQESIVTEGGQDPDTPPPVGTSGGTASRGYRMVGAERKAVCEENEDEREWIEKRIAELEAQFEEVQARIETEDDMRELKALVSRLNEINEELAELRTKLADLEAEDLRMLSAICEEMLD